MLFPYMWSLSPENLWKTSFAACSHARGEFSTAGFAGNDTASKRRFCDKEELGVNTWMVLAFDFPRSLPLLVLHHSPTQPFIGLNKAPLWGVFTPRHCGVLGIECLEGWSRQCEASVWNTACPRATWGWAFLACLVLSSPLLLPCSSPQCSQKWGGHAAQEYKGVIIWASRHVTARSAFVMKWQQVPLITCKELKLLVCVSEVLLLLGSGWFGLCS